MSSKVGEAVCNVKILLKIEVWGVRQLYDSRSLTGYDICSMDQYLHNPNYYKFAILNHPNSVKFPTKEPYFLPEISMRPLPWVQLL